MIVVSNTTPLIGLASVQQFALLEKLFGEIYIPQAVYDEACLARRIASGVQYAVPAVGWVNVVPVKDRLAVEILLDELDLGEAETIVLARELNADWVLMDERKGRRKLDQLGVRKIGTLGILLKAKQLGLLPAIRSAVETLHQQGFSLSQSVIDAVLQQAGE